MVSAVDIDTLLESKELDLAELEKARREVLTSPPLYRRLKKHLGEGKPPADSARKVKYGYFTEVAGNSREALKLLEGAGNDPVAVLARVRARIVLSDRRKALEEALAGAESKNAPAEVLFMAAELAMWLGHEKAAALRKQFEKQAGKDARVTYLDGLDLEMAGDYAKAMACYEKAYKADSTCASALFRLGFLTDLHGDDQKALGYYEKGALLEPTHTSLVLNLGLKYEDMGRYTRAKKCYRRVLAAHPSHSRARMYLEDAEASEIMFYDEERERRMDRRSQILRTPITDFELSVRSRNCLNKMNIRTLGDLVQKTEAELLSYKNFGETSLTEIKQILGEKGLRLGYGRVDAPEGDPGFDEALLAKGVDALDLSVRSRRCMESLGIRSLRELVDKSEIELMNAKNFGQTSLNEVKLKLAEQGLRLRT